MKPFHLLLFVAVGLLGLSACSDSTPAESKAGGKAATEFRGVEYFHRWTGGNQHEFTLAGQEHLDKWTEMITVIDYPEIKDGEGLARIANKILEVYKENGAQVMATDSVPRTGEKAAEYLIAVYFIQPDFMEAAFCRVMIHQGEALSLIYAHRIYGKDVVDEMNTWVNANGQATEDALMKTDSVPRK